ncbi:hypothetical protein [Arenicella xantha]|uniref:Uncharacterized protein n=1 Tax=Arenicella xantha TaxID=644221 RepID=A0A395JGA7_9GAMM|nr:hypothetical protein [Arenicella xantha]RBP48812.1 hypothetical protein DFR28_105151 [Arenicella xantha]
MNSRSDQLIFIAGLCIFSIGQFWIYYFGSTTKEFSTIDVSHWVMLLGVVLYLPYVMGLPRKGIALIASILMTIGIICMIGMCVIDLIFWAIPDDGMRKAVARELSSTPMIWQPFMLWGNEEVLMTGFILASMRYIKQSKIGPLLVTVGSIVAIAGASWYNFIAYILISIGFILSFDILSENMRQNSKD